MMRYMLSITAVAAKAQQEPHCCWLRIGVTLPAVTQLTEEAPTGVAVEKAVVEAADVVSGAEDMRYWAENCWLLRWKYGLPLALNACMNEIKWWRGTGKIYGYGRSPGSSSIEVSMG